MGPTAHEGPERAGGEVILKKETGWPVGQNWRRATMSHGCFTTT